MVVSKELIRQRIQESIEAKQALLKDEKLLYAISALANEIVESLSNGGKLLVCGNGGSAADALHIAGEILGRFVMERPGYAAIALNADVATLTAVGNDYGYDHIFSRQVEGLMNHNDVLLGISTSGNSENIVRAFEKAKEKGGKTALLTGKTGGKLKDLADYAIIVPANVTARIQECHTCIYHILCELVEKGVYEADGNKDKTPDRITH